MDHGPVTDNVICPNCGNRLKEFNPYRNEGKCDVCGSLVKGLFGSDNASEMFQRAVDFYNLDQLDDARTAASSFASRYPGDFRAWQLDYEFNANHNVGPLYDIRFEAVENMCRTIQDDHDRKYMLSVVKKINEDKDKLKGRIEELGGNVRELEISRVSTKTDNWKKSVTKEMDHLESLIDASKSKISSLSSGVKNWSYSEAAISGAGIVALIVGIALFVESCSSGRTDYTLGAPFIALLGAVEFGIIPGAIIGLIIAGLVNYFHNREKKQEEKILHKHEMELIDIKLELGLATEADKLSNEIGSLSYQVRQLDMLAERIANALSPA